MLNAYTRSNANEFITISHNGVVVRNRRMLCMPLQVSTCAVYKAKLTCTQKYTTTRNYTSDTRIRENRFNIPPFSKYSFHKIDLIVGDCGH